MRKIIVSILKSIRLLVLNICSTNRFLARIYFLVDPAFDREYEYTLKGRVQALSSSYLNDNSNANLRRSIHRLEKGLFHKNRKKQFGRDVFGELKREVANLYKLEKLDFAEIDWAIETLEEYESFSYNPTEVKSCISKLVVLREKVNTEKFDEIINNESFSTLKSIFIERESVRYFEQRPIDTTLLEAAVSIAKEAPSACNRQPFSLQVIQDKESINYIGGLAPGTAGFLDNIPCLIAVVGHASAFRFARDRHLIYTDSGLFLGHLLPALKSLNLDSCVLNWTPDWDKDRKAIKHMGLDLSKTIVCLMAIGYRDKSCSSPKSIKKTNKNILRFR